MKISWEHLWESMLGMSVRNRLRDAQQLRRFGILSQQYEKLCRSLGDGHVTTIENTPGYEWEAWALRLRKSFATGVPIDFLSHPILAHSMVFARRRGVLFARRRIQYVIDTFQLPITSKLLREDYIGIPTIVNARFITSANRCHHGAHLACYSRVLDHAFWDMQSIIEWGGGYGDMARIVFRNNPDITYTIIDIPEMLALQFVYLASLLGEEYVNIHPPGSGFAIVPGKINLLPVSEVKKYSESLFANGFISTWALTESPKTLQRLVLKMGFFGAERILIGSMINENNSLAQLPLVRAGLTRIPLPELGGLGPGNEFWFR